MAHPRKVIRHAVADLLVGKTAAGARVTTTRSDPNKKLLPALSVYALSEPVTSGTASAPRELERELKLEVVGWVAHTDALPVDDAMDDLAEQVEAAMNDDPYLGGLAGDSILDSTDMEVIQEGGDPLVGIVVLTYSVTYRTFVDTTEATDDFLRAGVTTQLVGGVPDTAPATDLVTVQEPP